MRQTKIIATVGPASDTDAVLDALIAAGVDIVRLNFSHGTHESHAATLRARPRRRRSAPAARSRSCRISAVRRFAPDRSKAAVRSHLKPGDVAAHRHRRVSPATRSGFRRPSPGSREGVRPGDRLLLSDGTIELRVESTDGGEIVTTVVEGGLLGGHKGINAPGIKLPTSAITMKDVDDLDVRPVARRRHGGAQLRAERRRRSPGPRRSWRTPRRATSR